MSTMSKKRSIPDLYSKTYKKVCGSTKNYHSVPAKEDEIDKESSNLVAGSAASNISVAVEYLHGLFPVEKFDNRLPPIILKHQLYSLSSNRTKVDQYLNVILKKNEVRLFKLGSIPDEFCLVYSKEYKDHVEKFASNLCDIPKGTIDKFLENVIAVYDDISLTKHEMTTDFKFTENEIKDLVKSGVLSVRDVGSWWISIPDAGLFMKSFITGRKAMLLMIRKCKYKEILQKELEDRKLPKAAKLGITYHIHDIIGADLVSCIETTSGRLLRLNS